MKNFFAGIFVAAIIAAPAYSQTDFAIPGMPEPGKPVDWQPPVIHEDILPNGLRVLYARTNGIPLVDINIIVDAGAVSEPEGQSGITTLTANMVMSGSTKRGVKEVAAELSRYATTTSQNVHYQAARFYFSSLKEHLPQTLSVIAELITTPGFDSLDFRNRKEKLLSSIVKTIDNPADMTSRTLLKTMYGEDIPFAYSPNGRYRDAFDLDLEKCKEFYRSTYTPNNTTIVITGDAKYEDIRALLLDRFGRWEKGGKQDSPQYGPDYNEPEIVVINNTAMKQAIFRIGFPCTSRDSRDFERLLLLNEVFGADRSSRLMHAFMGERVLTPYIGSGISFHRSTGYSVIGGSIPSRYVDTALATAFNVIEFMKDSLVSEDELNEAKKVYTDNFDLEFSTNRKLQTKIQEIAIYGLPLDYYQSYIQRFSIVTSEQIRDVANVLFDAPWVIVVSGDASVIAPMLEKRYGVPVQVVTPDEILSKDRPVSYDSMEGG